MKRAFSVFLLAATGCRTEPDAACPAIDALAQRDAVADARAALAKGDHHLLMLGGFVGSLPGVQNAGSYPTRMMEGTSDTETEACAHRKSKAESYAAKYNRTIVAGSDG
jgi:hypothetical protein